ncbi:hypothetical protein GLGCALEP_03440 [Pseudomonas sp. MM221]|nr:hypothetical protein GLGCALEP_03440 [Pseudomonas sp. MM221]
MASTQLSDIFVSDYYGTLEPVNSPEKTAVFESGIITRSATLDDIAKNGQGTSEISYWQDLDADEAPNISNDDPDDQGEVGKAEQGSMRARTLYLNKGYGVSDLAAEPGQLRADAAHPQPLRHLLDPSVAALPDGRRPRHHRGQHRPERRRHGQGLGRFDQRKRLPRRRFHRRRRRRHVRRNRRALCRHEPDGEAGHDRVSARLAGQDHFGDLPGQAGVHGRRPDLRAGSVLVAVLRPGGFRLRRRRSDQAGRAGAQTRRRQRRWR